ncbi:sensor domain-containing diguanylate cyclase [Oceanicella sp. SM1341]|uniref:sensor domain-containing diguanylate cyclase n=1 Tax=Oceanicella sp. SM1341 TaxID=1548889 RepID=UPI000E4DB5B2|nr:sensor domain-containing diguanylate cyclase [Oceanicella sp. SM1341]
MTDAASELLSLLERADVLVALFDGFDRLRLANAAFRGAFALEPGETPTWAEIMRRNHRAGRGTVIGAPDFEAWLLETQARRGKTAKKSYETDLHDGRWLLMTETVQENGWMLCVASDITGLRATSRQVRQARDFALKAAQTDELTGIANRRSITRHLAEALLRPAPPGLRLGCVCMLDIDHFKRINDTFGHSAGDTVLRHFSREIMELVRRSDLFGRIGGEEFMLVLPATSAEEAELILGRMLFAIRRARPFGAENGYAYTFSAGIAGYCAGDTVDDVFHRADMALYSAKVAGRNRVFSERG